jgi:hypothetical protein
MIVDIHSHLMWYPDHISEQWASEALASKLVKLKMSGGEAYAGALDLHSYDSHPDQHWAASASADRVVVFGLQAKAVGVWVPNELIAEYAAAHPDKIIGWASIDPNEPDCVAQLEHAIDDLGLRGLKLGPVYQHFDPEDTRHWDIFELCEARAIPVIWHQGTTFPSKARLKWGSPLQLEAIAMQFPDLRMIIAHLGHPWEDDTVALIRKCPNVYTDVSACHYRPWRYWMALINAIEYGVSHKLLLGSDFPSGTIDNVINGLRRVNDVVQGTSLPVVSVEVQESIIRENWKQLLPDPEGVTAD